MADHYRKTTLVLVRHGQARPDGGSGSYREAPLTQLGRRQVAALASELSNNGPIDAVYVSPFPRALETAQIICDKLGLEPVVDPRLAEFQLAGMSVESATDRPDLLTWRPEHKGATGETLAEFCSRVATFCEYVVKQDLGQRVAVVSHSGTIDAQVRWALGIGPHVPWEHDFEAPNASITELEYWPRGRIDGGPPRYTAVLRVGDVNHLGEMATDI